MIYEELEIKEQYYKLSESLVDRLRQASKLDQDKLVIAIYGESGSGKSTTAMCLQKGLTKINIESAILHQDNYFKLAPKDNHAKRKANINWVGPDEVQLDLLQSHIEEFRSGNQSIQSPVVNYLENNFSQSQIALENKSILIIEGVYAFLLQNLDYTIFLEKTYLDTRDIRKKRRREVYDPFVEEVLEIEHHTIIRLNGKPDIQVNKNYEVIDCA